MVGDPGSRQIETFVFITRFGGFLLFFSFADLFWVWWWSG